MPRYPTRRATSAGGVVCGRGRDGGLRVLLIARRNAAGVLQWTLPKGGREDDETDREAALREVAEETGVGAVVSHLLGTIDYWFVWRPDRVRYHKFVHYYFMWWDGRPAGHRDDEAEDVEWVPVDAAVVRLAHDNERDLVAKARDCRPRIPQPNHAPHLDGPPVGDPSPAGAER